MMKIWHNILAKQLRKPSGILGKMVADKLQVSNAPAYDWMLSVMKFEKAKNILEIGYGTGMVLKQLASKYSGVKLFGIDFSNVMYEKAIVNNNESINNGQMKLECGNMMEYNPPVKFDVIFGINVIYFWEDLEPYFTKIFGLLENGGVLYLYMTDAETLEKMSVGQTEVFNLHKTNSVIDIATKCGFSKANFVSQNIEKRKCHCLVAIK
jgi:trans-aconitate methyltransferase